MSTGNVCAAGESRNKSKYRKGNFFYVMIWRKISNYQFSSVQK